MSLKIDLEDILGEASSLVQAVKLAAEGLQDSRNACAFSMLAIEIADRLERARDIIDDLKEDSDVASD